MINTQVATASRDAVGKKVRTFYEGCSFPGYDEFDSPQELVGKAGKGVYARLLDEQLPLGARILDAGCGTGQLAIFLSLVQRRVLGIDLSQNSLRKASAFRSRFGLKHVNFAQMDLFNLALKESSFDYVFSNGVLHHTADAYGAFRNLCRLVKPGGYITIGLYNTYGRLFLDLRRVIFLATNGRFTHLDYWMRKKDMGDDRKRIWYMDQYEHPHEDKFSVGDVLRWFRENDIEYVNSIPKIRLSDQFSAGDRLFEARDCGTSWEHLLSQLGWIFTMGKEGGFFITIGRKRVRELQPD